MYDIIASEYGYKLHDFLELSTRELVLLLDKISDRTYNKYVMDASLHGIKLAPRTGKAESVEFTDEQMSRAEIAIKAAQERKRKEMAAKKRG